MRLHTESETTQKSHQRPHRPVDQKPPEHRHTYILYPPTQTNHQSNLEANRILEIVFIFYRRVKILYKSSHIMYAYIIYDITENQ